MMSRVDKLFDSNIRRLALLIFPTWLRRPLVSALLFSGISPLTRLLGELRIFRKETTYRLTHNGQVCKLRSMLNDEFDPQYRRILIEDGDSSGKLEASKVWMRDEGKWIMLKHRGEGVALLHPEGFNGTSGYDFWVNVPSDLRDSEREARMRALVNMYKLACKRYTIIYQ